MLKRRDKKNERKALTIMGVSFSDKFLLSFFFIFLFFLTTISFVSSKQADTYNNPSLYGIPETSDIDISQYINSSINLSGSGTTGYIPIWSGSSSLGDSLLNIDHGDLLYDTTPVILGDYGTDYNFPRWNNSELIQSNITQLDNDAYVNLVFGRVDGNPFYSAILQYDPSIDSFNVYDHLKFWDRFSTQSFYLNNYDGTSSIEINNYGTAGKDIYAWTTPDGIVFRPQAGSGIADLGEVGRSWTNFYLSGSLKWFTNHTGTTQLASIGIDSNSIYLNNSNGVKLSNQLYGTDNSVLIFDSDNVLRTDEIDSRVWGTSLIDGTGSAKTVSFWADSNTQTYDTLFVYDSVNDRLGIGTSSAQKTIHIYNTESPTIRIDTTNVGASFLEFYDGTDRRLEGSIVYDNNGNDMKFYTNANTLGMTLNSGQTLSVEGNFRGKAIVRADSNFNVNGVDGYSGTCVNATYSGGIVISCND